LVKSISINQVKREWLKELRAEKELKTREIAEILGISFQHYNDIENGRRNPSIELSLEMAKFFNVPIEQFLEMRTKFKRSESNE
jgi:putative transcriptional regulator